MTNRDVIEVIQSWPQPDSGAPEPRVTATEGCLTVTYITAEEKFAVIEFPLCHQFTFGHPNDESLQGHPLYSCGLKFYSVHQVKNSSRISELERINSSHPQHNKAAFLASKSHYVFTFHDSTLECIVTNTGAGTPKVKVFDSSSQAGSAISNRAA